MKQLIIQKTILLKALTIIHLITHSLSETINLASSISICPLNQIYLEGNESSCFSYSSPSVKCCILKKFRKDLPNLVTNVCWGFKAESIQDIYNYGGYNYKVFCEDNLNKEPLIENFSPIADESHLKACAVSRPETVSDCTAASDDTGSCCLYTYNSIKQCTKLGKRFNGDITYGALQIFCAGYFNSLSIFSYLLFFILYLIL